MSLKRTNIVFNLILLSLLFGLLPVSSVQARSATGAYGVAVIDGKNADKVHLRAFSSTDSESLGLFFSGTQVLCESNPFDEWTIVGVGAQFGYIMSKYLSFDIATIQSKQPMGRIKGTLGNSVTVRAEPVAGAATSGTAKVGETVVIQGETKTHWYYVLVNGQFGYVPTSSVSIDKKQSVTNAPIVTVQPTPSPTASIQPQISDYQLKTYRPTARISIQYPVFAGHRMEQLNNQIYLKAQQIGEYGSADLFIDNSCAVTFYNDKVVSMVFWGKAQRAGGAYQTDTLTALTLDLTTLNELKPNDLLNINVEFEKIFFRKAFFPTPPVTSYDATLFSEMLRLQSPEYSTISPFSIANNIQVFLKPDGMVFSMPAIHATGSDHFEAQLSYIDVQKYLRFNLN